MNKTVLLCEGNQHSQTEHSQDGVLKKKGENLKKITNDDMLITLKQCSFVKENQLTKWAQPRLKY
jgi:hypothetical protein